MPHIPSDDDMLDKMLAKDDKREQKDLDVLKELFTKKDIETKTELNINQVIAMNQKRTIAKMLDWEGLDSCLSDFMLLMVSKDRKGRGEFVEGFKAERETNIKQQTGFFSKLTNQFSGK